ncbi:MAG: YggU family protein [Candidatus Electrothrix sp. AR3]|nr:YggU family protein [Candidatus Electrothrix sp. AR3]
MPYLQTRPDGKLLLSLHVQPGATRNQCVGLHGNALKVRITAPPVAGKANKAVVIFLAEMFSIPQSAITIKSGLQSRAKRLLLTGIDEQNVRSLLKIL